MYLSKVYQDPSREVYAMKINFDQKHDVMRIKFQEGSYGISKEVGEGIVVDMTKGSSQNKLFNRSYTVIP